MRKLLRVGAALALCAAVAAGTAQAGPKKQDVVNLTFATYVWQPTTVAATKAIVDSWNKSHPGIQVQILPVDVNSVHDKLLTSFVGGTAADIVHDEAADIPGFTQQGYLANLTPLIPKELKAEIPKPLWDTVNFSHKITGVPIMSQTYNVFANMDQLKAAGVKAPTVASPWTWDKFRAVAKQLSTNGNYGVCWGLRSPTATIQTMSLNWGGQWNYLQKGRWVLNVGAGEQKMLTTIHDMIYVDKSFVLRRQVRDDDSGQLPGTGHDRAEPAGLQLGDVPAAEGKDAGPGGESADALDLAAEPAQVRGDAVHRLRPQLGQHGEAGDGRLADPGGSVGRDDRRQDDEPPRQLAQRDLGRAFVREGELGLARSVRALEGRDRNPGVPLIPLEPAQPPRSDQAAHGRLDFDPRLIAPPRARPDAVARPGAPPAEGEAQ